MNGLPAKPIETQPLATALMVCTGVICITLIMLTVTISLSAHDAFTEYLRHERLQQSVKDNPTERARRHTILENTTP